MAKKQTAGKGQRGTTWSSPRNENLTVSYFFSPKKLDIKDQFTVTILSSLAVYDILERFIPSQLSIKWPNDIMVKNKKIAGILIENKITSTTVKHSIIGIGINVLTAQFPDDIAHKATSIRLENFDFNLTIVEMAKLIQQRLIYYNHLLEAGQEEQLWELYSKKLFRKNIKSTFIVNEVPITGIITGVDRDGFLLINIDNNIKKYDLKNIAYQL